MCHYINTFYVSNNFFFLQRQLTTLITFIFVTISFSRNIKQFSNEISVSLHDEYRKLHLSKRKKIRKIT